MNRTMLNITESEIVAPEVGLPISEEDWDGRNLRGTTSEAKGRLLDEVCEVTGYHRKAVIRLLRQREVRRRRGRRGRPVRYTPEVVAALRAIWTAAGYPWWVRLEALLPLWLPWARKRLARAAAD